MGLIVAAADASASRRLMDRCGGLEAGARACGDLDAVLDSCDRPGAPDCVLCNDLEWAEGVAARCPRLAVVYVSSEVPDSPVMLRALRAGLADVWTETMSLEAMRERLAAVRARQGAVAGAAEQRLRVYSQELERDQRAGRYVQMGMLPPNPMAIEQYRFEHRILPSMYMSGDFVDYFRLTDRHFAFYAADVSGHGASSAFVTVLLKNFSRRLRREHRPAMLTQPGLVLEWINRELLEQRIGKHVALMLGIGDLVQDQIVLVNAGHYPPAIRVGANGAELVEQKGKPVGLFESVEYAARVLPMAPGDRLVMFSDGIMDALPASSLAEREARLLAAASTGPELMDVWRALGLDGEALQKPDDMTCLIVRRES